MSIDTVNAIGILAISAVNAIGVIAISSGNAIGLVSFGGLNATGIIAIGRMHASGCIAIGRTANGRFALSRSGKGHATYMLSPNRRDEDAVRLFSRIVPASMWPKEIAAA